MNPVFAELQIFRDVEPRSAAMNMALDETLLEHASSPVLRFYGWARPSLSFGYFGSLADLSEMDRTRDVVRRWTGGGVVLHGSDFTYSVILPSKNEVHLPSARFIYTELHEAIRRALRDEGFVRLAEQNAPKISEACFANPVVADVLAHGRKIAGAAQRRTRAGLLHQGSIQYEALPCRFAEAFASELSPHLQPQTFAPEILERAEHLVAEKYGTTAWLRRR
ncbi:MAG: hypothetical protein M3505_13165 [Verrucomicrobiota bacterium]|nr:hypothetical protein [Verrucomicrobiota bacterium]